MFLYRRIWNRFGKCHNKIVIGTTANVIRVPVTIMQYVLHRQYEEFRKCREYISYFMAKFMF